MILNLNVSLSPRPCRVNPFGPTSGNPKRMAGMVVKAPGHQGRVMLEYQIALSLGKRMEMA